MSVASLLAAIALNAALAHSPRTIPAEFAKHPAASTLRGKSHALLLDTAEKRRFRTMLRTESAEGANFNGHYRVASWGCGTNCIEWAVVDLAKGKVWMAPEAAHSCWVPEAPDDPEITDWFEMYEGSSLLYLYTCRDRENDRTFDSRSVYEWSEGELRLIRVDQVRSLRADATLRNDP
ncbi:MAG: hypothetical protein QOC81_2017 [Thermoanaerobaculia bacterium]|jgi:hypothetical protein|nr:hypothetical protein [Thermoanaerobaculia bacterium]